MQPHPRRGLLAVPAWQPYRVPDGHPSSRDPSRPSSSLSNRSSGGPLSRPWSRLSVEQPSRHSSPSARSASPAVSHSSYYAPDFERLDPAHHSGRNTPLSFGSVSALVYHGSVVDLARDLDKAVTTESDLEPTEIATIQAHKRVLDAIKEAMEEQLPATHPLVPVQVELALENVKRTVASLTGWRKESTGQAPVPTGRIPIHRKTLQELMTDLGERASWTVFAPCASAFDRQWLTLAGFTLRRLARLRTNWAWSVLLLG